MAVQIPGKAVSTGDNIESPTVDLLRALNLLGTDTEITASGKWLYDIERGDRPRIRSVR